MISDALLNFLAPIGVLIIMTGLLKGFMDLSRGYPGGVGRILGSLAAGGILIASPTILPALVSSTSTVLASPDAKDTAAKKDEEAPLFERVFGDNSTDGKGSKDAAAAEEDQSPSAGISAETIFVILAGVAAFALTLGLIAAVYFGVRHQRRKQAEARTAAEQARVEEEARLNRVWDEAVARHDHLREEMMRHMSDIDLVLSMPLINDQNDPTTAAFTEALARAADLSHDTRPTSAAAVEAYASATRTADRAWGAAWRNADRVRLSNFTSDERATIKQVAKLMQRAENETTPEARRSYYTHAAKMLGNLIEIPAPAMEAIEQSVAGILANPASRDDDTVSIDEPLLTALLRKAATVKTAAKTKVNL